ncbi:jg6891 [Pararge aegeria aegeria]|uniref:Jg6891 protein n=1 Tax=Pararge aegeria aegeria TaxID=348720 RepID=A0A8S4RS87_9NEOP|nr:jg6891 [Pararge aegeria aegeria]
MSSVRFSVRGKIVRVVVGRRMRGRRRTAVRRGRTGPPAPASPRRTDRRYQPRKESSLLTPGCCPHSSSGHYGFLPWQPLVSRDKK